LPETSFEKSGTSALFIYSEGNRGEDMELSPRLRSIAEKVPQGARLADIGTDHAYLPVWLLLNRQIEKAIAADLRKGPLERAQATARQYGQSGKISFRLCNGLSDIQPNEVDTVVIAGMGGETIAAILESAPWTRQNKLLLLQPMTGAPQLRQWLQTQGYIISDEIIVREGKRLYSIWIVKGGTMAPFSPAELWAGRNRSGPLRLEYLSAMEEKAEKSLRGHLAAQVPDQAAISLLKTVTAGLSIMKKELQSMTTVGEVFTFLQEKAPFELQEDFDNAGFLVGREEGPVSKVLVALDITEQVVQEAAEQGAQLIVAHHPVIFGGTMSVTNQTVTGRILLALTENKIAAICAHTNLDSVEGGVNDALALRLGLTDISQLKQTGVDRQGRPYGIGRVGRVTEQHLYDFAMVVKRLLGANGIRLVDGGKPVRRVAVGGGACADMMGYALAQGCDTFVTADVKYHQFLEARALGLNLLDAGHFPTENVVCPVLQDWLSKRFPKVTVAISQRHTEIFSYL